jgi:hypothetical protein
MRRYYESHKIEAHERFKRNYRLNREAILAYQAAYYDANSAKVQERIKSYQVSNITAVTERIKKYARHYRANYPQHYLCHMILGNAVRSGKIIKPEECSECHQILRRIDAHHEDYSKPLEVVWLCHKCHMRLHRMARRIKPEMPGAGE